MWHEQQETILKAWGEAAACYRYIHHQCFMDYAKTAQRLASGHCAIDHHGHSVFRDGVGPGKSATDRIAIDRCGQSHRGFDRNDLYVFKVK